MKPGEQAGHKHKEHPMIKQVILKAALAAVLIGAASVARAQDPDVTGGTDNPAAAEPMSAIQTGRDIAKGIGEATVEVGGAVKSGGAGVMAQPRALWQDAVLPMLQRTTTALPTLIKALLLLIAFWIVARIAGGVVTKSLGLTKLDEKAAKD
ncbi:MAG: hypothetical protein O3B24_10395, partial [Verrucomicrobia bacterium]|nr:hypothetical protein [Verrucomicrobiota bacterium]